jgi:hypothetical protein
MKDQLIIALVKKAGGKVSLPVEEIDDTGGWVLMMNIRDRTFNFEARKKQ